jgi:hypothetical protein
MTATKGFVVPAGGGKHLGVTAPGRVAALKLLGHETSESIIAKLISSPAAFSDGIFIPARRQFFPDSGALPRHSRPGRCSRAA